MPPKTGNGEMFIDKKNKYLKRKKEGKRNRPEILAEELR